MQLLVISFLLIAVVILNMSVGVLMGRKPVQGSCGGINQIDGMGECGICGGDMSKCEDGDTSGKGPAKSARL
ncbi:MAG: (Na+)-NQR maturation NqrM [Gammaproteobacteria bacterium]|nr:(Na+)-NQR maturation NqrM [Gammaproteobacteria bacterium]